MVASTALYSCVALLIFDLGEFGVVYRGHLTGWEGRTTAELVAVKTLKSKHKLEVVYQCNYAFVHFSFCGRFLFHKRC